MATSEENDLIGYDPLTWMEGNAGNNEDHLATDEKDGNQEIEELQAIDDGIVLIDNDLGEAPDDAEQNEILQLTNEDQLVIDDESDDESVSILMEDMAEESVPVKTETAGTHIDLDATLAIQNVVMLHEKIKDVLAVQDHIEINASHVSSIDTSTLQLLVSLKKEAAKQQKEVAIISPSPRFVESAQLLGLSDVLGVHEV